MRCWSRLAGLKVTALSVDIVSKAPNFGGDGTDAKSMPFRAVAPEHAWRASRSILPRIMTVCYHYSDDGKRRLHRVNLLFRLQYFAFLVSDYVLLWRSSRV